MGKVSQHFMEEIESDCEFQELVNPRFGNEPDPDYEGELIHWAKHILENAESLLFQRDQVIQKNTMSIIMQQLNHMKFLAGEHYRRLSEQCEVEREDKEEAREDYEAMEDVYAGVRASFI